MRQDDVVVIRNCPPVSARKRFALEKILKSPELEAQKRKAQVLQSMNLNPSLFAQTAPTPSQPTTA